jgi:hypothetical protein
MLSAQPVALAAVAMWTPGDGIMLVQPHTTGQLALLVKLTNPLPPHEPLTALVAGTALPTSMTVTVP